MKTNSKQKSALLVMLLSLLIPNIMAQEPKMPTLEDLIPVELPTVLPRIYPACNGGVTNVSNRE